MSQSFRSTHDPCGWPKPQRPKTTHAPFATSNKESCHANTSRPDPAVLYILRPGLARSKLAGSLEGRYRSSRRREEAEKRREFALQIRLVISAAAPGCRAFNDCGMAMFMGQRPGSYQPGPTAQVIGPGQFPLQIQAAQSGQAHVEHQAGGCRTHRRAARCPRAGSRCPNPAP